MKGYMGLGSRIKNQRKEAEFIIEQVSKLRQRCVERGLDAALEREPRKRERSRVLDGDAEAQVIALMCSEPPAGQSRWTLKLLGHRLVELESGGVSLTRNDQKGFKKTLLNRG